VEIQVHAGGSGQNDVYDWYGMWENAITFANGTTNMELRGNSREAYICITAAANCPTTYTLTASVFRTDGTSAAATSPSYSSVNPSVCTVGASTGVVSPVAMGDCEITISANGFTRNVWVFVFNNSNLLPHFGTDGSILTSYNPAKSIYLNSSFLSDASLNTGGGTYLPYPNFGYDYAATWNTMETGAFAMQPGTSQSSFQSGEQSSINGIISFPIRLLTIRCAERARVGLLTPSPTRGSNGWLRAG
jgi:hypothetical protein